MKDKKQFAQQAFQEAVDNNINVSRMLPAFQIDLLTAMAIISQIQLASRHKLNNQTKTAKHAQAFARNMQAKIVEIEPRLNDVLQMGWDPEFDY